MLKIGWGTKITILYVGFVLLIGTMVIACMYQKIDLVSDDYYDKELAFQSKIDEMNNANSLVENVKHTIDNQGVQLFFPDQFKDKKIDGDVFFFRPSDNTKDFKTPLELKENRIFIGKENLSKGMYKMQISWKAEGKDYFDEETIVIP